MRVAVILVWRPKNFPDWDGRTSPTAAGVPRAMARDRWTAPYSATHIASLLPREWDIQIVHEAVRDLDPKIDVDAVFLSTMDFCAPRARKLAREFRARGVTVIVGGLYPTANPAYFAADADAIVVGEAEPVMPQLIADLRRRRLSPVYRSAGVDDLQHLPIPRFDLVEPAFTVPLGYEVTRGCPFACSFCVLSAMRSPYRRRPIPHVVRDLRAVPGGWNWLQRKMVTFWDNNLGADRVYFRDLCEALVPLKRFWATQTSIDTITPESARLMSRAGCRYVYIGLESLTQDSLRASNKRHNHVAEYRRRITYLHQNGIVVMSIFLLGLDGDTSEYLRVLPTLVEDIGVDIPVYSLPVPIEGTPFREQLRDRGRLLEGDLLDGSDAAQLLYRPRNVSPDELELALGYCMRWSYHPARTLRRVLRRIPNGPLPLLSSSRANWVYMRYERAVARVALSRIQRRGPWPGPAATVGCSAARHPHSRLELAHERDPVPQV
jgi:radical SAM superfamily enzyme YgiQ (UPF0313 family)